MDHSRRARVNFVSAALRGATFEARLCAALMDLWNVCCLWHSRTRRVDAVYAMFSVSRTDDG